MIARNVTTMIFLAASVMSVPARSEETRTASAPDPRVIQSLIDELNSDDFRVRETATRRLSEMGRPAIEPVVRAMDHGSLEVIVRATTILERIYRAGDDETIDEVESALERLGRHTNRSVSGRAEVVLVKCYPIRERRALEEIRLAGGVFIREVDKRETVVTETSGLSYNGLLLHLENWKAGDAGLRHVKRLTRLQALRIVPGVSGISAEAIRDLAAAMPALHIHERGAAKLGLVGQASQAPKGCEILRIERATWPKRITRPSCSRTSRSPTSKRWWN